MPYTPQVWEDLPATTTPITAARLAYIESGIVAATSLAELPGDFTLLINKPLTFAPSTHTHTAAQITNFNDSVASFVSTMVVAGANTTVVYDAATKKLTISATGGGSVTSSDVVPIVNTALVAGNDIAITYDAATSKITLASTTPNAFGHGVLPVVRYTGSWAARSANLPLGYAGPIMWDSFAYEVSTNVFAAAPPTHATGDLWTRRKTA